MGSVVSAETAVKLLTEQMRDDLVTVARNHGAHLRGGMNWTWGTAPSKVRARLDALVARGLLERGAKDSRQGHFYVTTDLGTLVVAIVEWGHAMRRFVGNAEQERRERVYRERRRAALVASCAKWLEGRAVITAEDLADFVGGGCNGQVMP